MKDTALVAFLGVVLEQADLFRRAQLIGNQDLKRLESLIIAAAMYWALTAVFTFFQMRLERRMSAGYVRGEAQTAMGRKRTNLASHNRSVKQHRSSLSRKLSLNR
jgi:polar amino acid transport system permease protein